MKNFFSQLLFLPAIIINNFRGVNNFSATVESCHPAVFDFNSIYTNQSLEEGKISFIRTEINKHALYLDSVSVNIEGGDFISVIPPDQCKAEKDKKNFQATCNFAPLYDRFYKSSLTFQFVAQRLNGSIPILPAEIYVKCRGFFSGKQNRSISNLEECILIIESDEKKIKKELIIAISACAGVGFMALLCACWCRYSGDGKKRSTDSATVESGEDATRILLSADIKLDKNKIRKSLWHLAKANSPVSLGATILLVVARSFAHGFAMPHLLVRLYRDMSKIEDEDFNIDDNIIGNLWPVPLNFIAICWMHSLIKASVENVSNNVSNYLAKKIIIKTVKHPADSRHEIDSLLPNINATVLHAFHDSTEILESILEVCFESIGMFSFSGVVPTLIFMGAGFFTSAISYFMYSMKNINYEKHIEKYISAHHQLLESIQAIKRAPSHIGRSDEDILQEGSVKGSISALTQMNDSYGGMNGLNSIAIMLASAALGMGIFLHSLNKAELVNNSKVHYETHNFEHDLAYGLFFYITVFNVFNFISSLKLHFREIKPCIEFLENDSDHTMHHPNNDSYIPPTVPLESHTDEIDSGDVSEEQHDSLEDTSGAAGISLVSGTVQTSPNVSRTENTSRDLKDVGEMDSDENEGESKKIMGQLKMEYSFFRKTHECVLIENRYESSMHQRAYDKRFGLVSV